MVNVKENILRFAVFSCIQTGKVFQGGGRMDSYHRCRNQFESCLKNQRNVDKYTRCVSDVELEENRHIVRELKKNTDFV